MTPWSAIATVAAHGTTTIPFRQDTGGVGSSAVGVLTVTVVLLALLAAAAWYARRRGWLDRWAGPAPRAQAPRMRLEQSLRLSPRTTLYRVNHEGRILLVVESTATARIEAFPGQGRDGHTDPQHAASNDA
ncbi:MAG TPA: hypothetical protein VGE88_11640 [Lysobacter sp.]